MYLCVRVPPFRKMASRPPSLLIPALPGPSLGTAYQAPSTPLKVKSNLCLVAPFFFFAFSIFLLPFMSLHSFPCALGFFSFFFLHIFALCFLNSHLFLCASDLLLRSPPLIVFTSPVTLSARVPTPLLLGKSENKSC